ncbi:hypothetical protein [Burkholderia pyrrocinia]|uniref:hypothetical protein n=1 Tax=Burkholderia pyrrocinia TaxID=60550 RepID=UPI00104C5936|nr:hypothetical protein [Burkholderia pyrrocinia]TDA47470.1 hypothetical protein EVG18_10670 [Burkholderia pyrrocinia]
MSHAKWIAAAALCTPFATWAASLCDRVPVRAASAQVVGEDMIANGLPMTVVAVQFDESPARVANAFHDYWKRDGIVALELTGPRGTTLSAYDGVCQYVVEIPVGQQRDRTHAVASAMRFDKSGVRHTLSADDAVLPGGNVLSDVESRDPLQVGRTWVIELGGMPDDGAMQYGDELRRHGWKVVAAAAAPEFGGSDSNGYALAVQKGKRQIDAVFSDRSGRTTAVINLVEVR